ncbi:Non-histone protein 10 [Cladorrhinum sp. PSN332]|nr:Non-histone protein 10 [Cladorrhinum sp. PSN332]
MAPGSTIPPPLPPSVEEAYRRKCVQLRARTLEVEAENEAAILRLTRMQRQVDKMRLERAFLLEQIAKRTSTNVEDSDGSPSPPPTVSIQPADSPRQSSTQHLDTLSTQPKEKPLRLKRGHRKASILPALDGTTAVGGGSGTGGAAGSTFINQHTHNTQSPSSDAFSTQPTNGLYSTSRLGAPPREPPSAFNMYCDANRTSMTEKAEESNDGSTVEDRLASGWKDLEESKREEFETQADEAMATYKTKKDAWDEAKEKEDQEVEENNNKQQQDSTQDVEMANYDTDDQETTQGGNGGNGSGADKGDD